MSEQLEETAGAQGLGATKDTSDSSLRHFIAPRFLGMAFLHLRRVLLHGIGLVAHPWGVVASRVVVPMRVPVEATPGPVALSTRFSLPLAIAHVVELLDFIAVISGVFVPLVEVAIRIAVPLSSIAILT